MKWRVSLRLIANTIPNDKNRSRQENKEWAFSLFPEVTIESADNATNYVLYVTAPQFPL